MKKIIFEKKSEFKCDRILNDKMIFIQGINLHTFVFLVMHRKSCLIVFLS